jgi:mannose-1-phosphate guanylyltransferase / mannose-6-phosphate isomerase
MSLPVVPVLMSGGRGTRLWPLSRSRRPKHLQPLLGEGTMLQATATRMAGVPGVTAPIVVCGVGQVEVIHEQLAEVGCTPMITVAEPVGRNTAPAIAAAALVAPDESVLAVLPADHIVSDVSSFRDAMISAVEAALKGHLVTFGVAPTRAETGYGYIWAEGDDDVRLIEEFTEKPDRETAARFVQAGNRFWNSGMFVFRPDVVLDEMRRVAPEIVDAVQRSLGPAIDGVIEPGPTFEHALSVAFDVAVMEKTSRAVMVPLDAGWSDIGSWRSLWEVSDRDVDENVIVGEGIVQETHRSYVRAGDRPVVVLGLDDVAVVDAGDVVFVASMKHAQDVRELVARLELERPDLT